MKSQDFVKIILTLGTKYYQPSSFSLPLKREEVENKLVSDREVLQKFVQYANLNEVGFWMRCELKIALPREEEMFLKFSRTLGLIKEVLDQNRIPWLLVKTLRGYPRLPNDLDVVVPLRSFTKAKEALISLQFSLKIEDKDSVLFMHPNYYKVHLHHSLEWAGSTFFSLRDLWRTKKEARWEKIKITTSSPEFEILIALAHSNFENLYLTLGECLYLFKLLDSYPIGWNVIQRQIAAYGWKETFRRSLQLLNTLHFMIYGFFHPKIPQGIERKQIDGKINFPYHFTRKHLFLSFMEKKMCWYSFKKIPKIFALFLGFKRGVDYIKSFETQSER